MHAPLLRHARALVLLGLLALLGGCAATQVALEHKDLAVETKMSATVFLDVEARVEKTVFLDIKNTSSRDLDLESAVRTRLEQKGYQIVPLAKDAFYILQVNVLQVGTANPSALHESLYAGWGGALAGGVAGAVVGGNKSGFFDSWRGSEKGAGIGGLIGGAGELISGALVKNVTYSILTDVQIMERSSEAVSQRVETSLEQGTGTKVVQTSDGSRTRKKYQTRILSTANKVNLKFEEALPTLTEQLVKSLAGLF